ncbi:hypothetical protein HDU97_009329 [Phlyctochytrium planicorne]|nr:hypothetical protein HDU97_009329 [Phlyctochytrium planicorne]
MDAEGAKEGDEPSGVVIPLGFTKRGPFTFLLFVKVHLSLVRDAMIVAFIVLVCMGCMGFGFEALAGSVPASGYSVMPAFFGVFANEAAVFIVTSNVKKNQVNILVQLPSILIVIGGNAVCLLVTRLIWFDGVKLRIAFIVGNTIVHGFGYFAWKHFCGIEGDMPVTELKGWKLWLLKLKTNTIEVLGSLSVVVVAKYLASFVVMTAHIIDNAFLAFFYQSLFLVIVTVTAKLDNKVIANERTVLANSLSVSFKSTSAGGGRGRTTE